MGAGVGGFGASCRKQDLDALPCWHGFSSLAAGSSPAVSTPLRMDLRRPSGSREQGWYLMLMAPNVKGPEHAWLDPSRLYCHHQVGTFRCLFGGGAAKMERVAKG